MITTPRLTTVTQPLESIARAAADLLVRRMAGDWSGFPCTVRLDAELHTRDSVARAYARAGKGAAS